MTQQSIIVYYYITINIQYFRPLNILSYSMTWVFAIEYMLLNLELSLSSSNADEVQMMFITVKFI